MLKVNDTNAASAGLLTSKAVDYIDSLKKELRQPRLKAKRRTEIEDDLAKIAAGKFVEINGVKHFIMDEGPTDGEAVILVHGWDCSSFWWHSIIGKLNEGGYRTINYDLRGHGLSDENALGNDDYSIKAYVNDLEAIRQHFKLEKFHVATFSLGSVIAVSYAAKYPEHVATLTAFNFGLFRYNPIVVKVMPITLSTVFSKVLRPMGPRSWRFVYYYSRLTLTKNPVDKRDILYGLLSLRDCPFRTSYNSARDIMSKPVLDELPLWCAAVKAPTLLVPGSHDRVIGKKNAKALADLIPNLTYFEMPKCGHLILAELPKQVGELMIMHLGKNSIGKRNEPLAHSEN